MMMMMMMMCFSWLRNGDDDDDVDEVPKTWWLFPIPRFDGVGQQHVDVDKVTVVVRMI